jgi:ionotropic glutamate receptor NMDA 1
MDLLKELAKKINITYELLLSPDGQFGSYVIRNSTGKDCITYWPRDYF